MSEKYLRSGKSRGTGCKISQVREKTGNSLKQIPKSKKNLGIGGKIPEVREHISMLGSG